MGLSHERFSNVENITMEFSPIGLYRRFLKFTNSKSKDKSLSNNKERSSSNIPNSSPYNIAEQKGIGFFFCLAAGRSPIALPKTLFFVLLCFLVLPSMTFANCVKGNCTNGKGVYITKGGNKYIGEFKNGQINGEGKWVSRYGDSYRGQFVKGRSEGKGKLTLSNGESYIGGFVNGRFHGSGKYAFKNGDDYIGKWQHGKMHGEGTYYFKNGTHKKGEYVDGKLIIRHQESEPEFASGNTFNEAEIVSLDDVTKDCTQVDCHNELGIFMYGDGTRYVGEFKNGYPNGQGKCEFANGDLYEGEWKMHAPDGKGVLTFASGRRHAAIWEQGTPKEQLLDDYEFISKFKNVTKSYDETVDIYALVVGVATYEHMPSLKYTDDDAYQLYAFLKSPEGGAIPSANIKVLVDDVATKNNILLSMDQLFSKADANDVVLLYMSGHGLEGAFIPSDFDGYKNQLSYTAINAILQKSEAKHKLLIADACHSGSLVASRGSSYAPAVNNYYNILENLESGGTAMLLSSAAKEVSLEYSGLRQGVFSHFLMKGLSGQADKNHDKVVTISELYQYMYKGVRDYTQNAQSPILTGSYNREMPVAVIR
ncbi:MAG: hypothetical protein ACI86M_000040 [Saprospiraceae bacterium]|jgi:hypothetical protein